MVVGGFPSSKWLVFRDRAIIFFHDLGQRIAVVTVEPRSFHFLMQRLSVAIQRGNAACIVGTVPSSAGWDELFTFSLEEGVCRGGGGALTCGSCGGIGLLEHAVRVLEGVVGGRLGEIVKIDSVRFGFMSGRSTTGAVFMVRVQGVVSYPDGSGCIMPHKGRDLQGLCLGCVDMWDWGLGDGESESAKFEEDGTDGGGMDVWGVPGGWEAQCGFVQSSGCGERG